MSKFTNSPEYIHALTGGSAALIQALSGSIAQREIEKSMGYLSSIEQLQKSFGLSSQLDNYSKNIAGLPSSKVVQEALGLHSSVYNTLSRNAAHSVEKLLGTSPGVNAATIEYAKAMDVTGRLKTLAASLNSDLLRHLHPTALESAYTFNTLSKSLNLGPHYESITALESASWISKLSTSLVEGNLYHRFLATLNIGSNDVTGIAEAAAFAAKHRYDQLFSVHDVWASQVERLKQPEYLSAFLADIEEELVEHPDIVDFVEEDPVAGGGKALLNELANAADIERFAEILRRSPYWIKWAILNMLLYVILPTMIGISVNLVTPKVEQYLMGAHVTNERKQVKGIKALSIGQLGVALRDYRFVTKTNLALRVSPNSRASTVVKLQFGQVVGVVSTRRDWTEITYEYGDGQVVTGWVFTRYTAKFRR